jgi:hypothetical protein
MISPCLPGLEFTIAKVRSQLNERRLLKADQVVDRFSVEREKCRNSFVPEAARTKTAACSVD